MIEEIHSGAINGLLARPISFYEYFLSLFVGQKLISTTISLAIPIAVFICTDSTTHFARLPIALVLAGFSLTLTHTICFVIASFGFYFNRIHAFTVAKNFALCLVTGELFPLDLLSEGYRKWILRLPFASAVYIPVGYLTGRVDASAVSWAFFKVSVGLMIFGGAGAILWSRGHARYSGTGA
jgi:ABC-2 type transport system permease protein